MGLLSRSEIQLFTGEGVKRLYQFFILNFCILLFQILILIILILGLSSQSFFDLISAVITSTFFVAFIWIIEILIIVWLFWAFADMIIGRKEFGKQHEISVIIASALLLPSIFLYLIQLILSKGILVSVSAFYFNPTGSLGSILPQGQILFAVSVIIPILMGPALFLFIHKLALTSKKVPLIFACGLLVISPFTIYITSLIAYILFFLVYRSVYVKLRRFDFKPTETAPCPFCNEDISMESRVCPYCGTKFEEHPDMKFDMRLRADVPKQKSDSLHGYTPVKGPTEEQKKKLFYIIGIIIVVIIVVATLVCLLR